MGEGRHRLTTEAPPCAGLQKHPPPPGFRLPREFSEAGSAPLVVCLMV